MLNSNTTLVKVKLDSPGMQKLAKDNSNTTLVKVKLFRKNKEYSVLIEFKYNTC